jgi:hypothetical protein
MAEAPRQVETRKHHRFGVLGLVSVLAFLVAGVCLAPRLVQLWQATEPVAVATPNSHPPSTLLTKPIEQIRPGERVLAHNPELTDEERSTPDPDPATWRLIELRLNTVDGQRIDVQFLRPIEWLRQLGARDGGTVELDLEELGAVGTAEVIRIAPCPPIDSGPGRVVTGTFRNQSDENVNVLIAGQPPVGCTAGHRFWSEDRRAFVHAGELQPGERLKTADGQINSVVSVVKRSGAEPVYNLEVDTEHVYYVGDAGVLVHNMRCGVIGAKTLDKNGKWHDASGKFTSRPPTHGPLVTSPMRQRHIIHGDVPAPGGGGHAHRATVPGKSKFPAGMTDGDIIQGVERIANDPTSYPHGFVPAGRVPGSRYTATGEINGVPVKVIVEPMGEGIITAFPE